MAPNSEMTKFIEVSFQFTSNTTDIKRLKSGFLIREMLKHFTEKTESKLKPDRSLWMYSGHDYTIVNLLSALGAFEVKLTLWIVWMNQVTKKNWNSILNLHCFCSLTFHHTPHAFYSNSTNRTTVIMCNYFIKMHPQTFFQHLI